MQSWHAAMAADCRIGLSNRIKAALRAGRRSACPRCAAGRFATVASSSEVKESDDAHAYDRCAHEQACEGASRASLGRAGVLNPRQVGPAQRCPDRASAHERNQDEPDWRRGGDPVHVKPSHG